MSGQERDLCDTCAKWPGLCPWGRDCETHEADGQEPFHRMLCERTAECSEYEEERR